KLVYYVACTVDRFIARSDGSFDFYLSEGQHLLDLVEAFPETVPGHMRTAMGVTAENRRFDTVLMGRATYEVGVKEGVTSPYPHMKQYLFSRTFKKTPDPDVELVATNAVAAVRQLKQNDGKDIWLCGGGELATVLFSEIDELILKVNPILLGAGIPLFSGTIQETALELCDSKIYSNGFTLLTYRLKHNNESSAQ
ncbi:MAG TPA: dihydrofolate reductase family protein, partial [Anaerolineales bacterium]|nr:dihydrofolate reductase family protein [Anaerolineales bacterium]